jgi:hypothetical protein
MNICELLWDEDRPNKQALIGKQARMKYRLESSVVLKLSARRPQQCATAARMYD